MELEDLGKPVRAEQIHQTPLLEKIVAFLGFVLVVWVLAVIVLEAKRFDEKPPEIVIRTEDVIAVAGGYLLRFEAKNQGSSATADLVIEGVNGDEKSQVMFDYIPAHSKREGGLFFSQDPKGAKLRALGYQAP